MRYIQRLRYLAHQICVSMTVPTLLLLLLTSVAASWLVHYQTSASQQQKNAAQAPTPFMHYPYYGNEKLQDRVNSYFDHDKPWYASDYTFVRYDGKRWTG